MSATQDSPMAHLAGQMADTALRGGNTALMLLLAEMQALGSLLPGTPPRSEAQERAHEAEVEDGFDNMPV